MKVAIEAHVARRIPLSQGGVYLVQVRNLLQLLVELPILGGFVGPSVYNIDVSHTFKLIIVMSSLCG